MKRIKSLTKAFSMMMLFAFLFSACEKENVIQNESSTLRGISFNQGMLEFDSEEDYASYKELYNEDWQSMSNLFTSDGFTNMYDTYENLYESLEMSETEAEFLANIESNSKYFTIVGDELLDNVELTIDFLFANADYQFMVAGKIKDLSIVDVDDASTQRGAEGNVSGCGVSYQEVTATKNVSGWKNDRRVKFIMKTEITIPVYTGSSGQQQYTETSTQVQVRGQRRRFSVYINYKTKLYWEDVSYNFQFDLNGAPSPYVTGGSNVNDYSSNSNEWSYSKFKTSSLAHAQYNTNVVTDNMVNFYQAEGKAWTQGTTTSYKAIINCQ